MKPKERLALGRESVVWMMFLTVITVGIYPSYWFYKRAPFFDGISRSKTNRNVPLLAILLASGTVAIGLLGSKPDRGSSAHQLLVFVEFVHALLLWVMAFHARSLLEDYAARIKRPRRASRLATFFFRGFYIQYLINRMLREIELEERERARSA